MRFSTVMLVAVAAAVGLVLVPELLPSGPTTALDAAGLLNSGQLFVAYGVIFLGGLLTALTPCVYPLIPITVGVFGARQASSRAKAVALTSTYVFGMGAVFSILGVVAALSGKAFGSILGNSWFVVGLAVFLVVLASSMFGAFELAIPSGLAGKMAGVRGGGFVGALLMGSVAGFLAAPCTGPVLTGVLAYVSRTQNPVLGGSLLFTYAMGIGVPFFLIGVFTLQLPKAGVWMEWVKSVFGIALLALAVSYLRDAFPSVRDWLEAATVSIGRIGSIGAAAVLTLVGVVMGAIHLSFKEGQQWVPKSMGISALLLAFLVRMAAPLAGASGTQPGGAPQEQFEWALKFNSMVSKSAQPFATALQKAKDDCKPVLIDFYADWCAACDELDKFTYVDSAVVAESKRFVNVKVDGTDSDEVLDDIYKKYDIAGLPTVIMLNANGEQMARVDGFMKAADFVKEMRKVGVTTCARTP